MCAIFTNLMISYIMVVTTNIVFGDTYYKCLASCEFPSNNITPVCAQHVDMVLYCNVF